MSEEIDINSKPISELEHINCPSNDDYLIIERHSGETNQSFKIKYSNFKKYFIEGLNTYTKSNFGDMIFHDKDEFSKFLHGHQYSDFYFYAGYGPKSNNQEYKSLLSCELIGQFNVKKYKYNNEEEINQISVYTPKPIGVFEDKTTGNGYYEVGNIDYIAVKDFNKYLTLYKKYNIIDGNINIYHESFDGFVIPNGKTFSCGPTEFREACKLYAGNEYATSFTVPNLNSFIKLNNNTDRSLDGNEYAYFNYHNGLLPHTHEIKQGGVSIDNIIMEFPGVEISSSRNSSLTSYYGYMHGGSGTDASKKLRTDGSDGKPALKVTNLSINGISINSTDVEYSNLDLDEESYPPYIDIPILIYIGNK